MSDGRISVPPSEPNIRRLGTECCLYEAVASGKCRLHDHQYRFHSALLPFLKMFPLNFASLCIPQYHQQDTIPLDTKSQVESSHTTLGSCNSPTQEGRCQPSTSRAWRPITLTALSACPSEIPGAVKKWTSWAISCSVLRHCPGL